MNSIIQLKLHPEYQTIASEYIWEQWGDASNRSFYMDCITQSLQTDNDLPRFYAVISNDSKQVIGCCALLRSELNSRQDLSPWLACLHVAEQARGQRLGDMLQQYAMAQAKCKGYRSIYLATDLVGYYERTGWTYIGNGYGLDDHEQRIYTIATS